MVNLCFSVTCLNEFSAAVVNCYRFGDTMLKNKVHHTILSQCDWVSVCWIKGTEVVLVSLSKIHGYFGPIRICHIWVSWPIRNQSDDVMSGWVHYLMQNISTPPSPWLVSFEESAWKWAEPYLKVFLVQDWIKGTGLAPNLDGNYFLVLYACLPIL